MHRKSASVLSDAAARRLLMLRCLEEADPAGERVPVDVRIRAGNEARDLSGEAFLVERARVLASSLPGTWREAMEHAESESAAGGFRPGPWVLLGAAFLCGWLTQGLGEERRVNLLAFPLLGLILWNVVVCTVAMVAEIRREWGRKPAAKPVRPRPPSRWAAWLTGTPLPPGDPRRSMAETAGGFVRDKAAQAWHREEAGKGQAGTAAGWLDGVHAGFAARWHALRLPGLKALGECVFHGGAIALAAGMVAGMYVKGLGHDYRAAWESTFLERPQVSKILRITLGPASMVTGIPVPPVPEEMAESPAAPWIHLWAASAALFVLAPRLLLIQSRLGARRKLGTDWSAEFAEWEESVRAVAGGRPPVALVIPFQAAPESPLRDALRRVLQHLWGGHVIVDFTECVPYGSEEEWLDGLTEMPSHAVLLWPFAVTPEAEIHGQTVRDLVRKASASGRSLRMVAVLETSGFDARMGALPEFARRTSERRRAWEKVLGPGIPLLLLDAAARRDPAAAADLAGLAREPVR